jgi:hypothetical protein
MIAARMLPFWSEQFQFGILSEEGQLDLPNYRTCGSLVLMK